MLVVWSGHGLVRAVKHAMNGCHEIGRPTNALRACDICSHMVSWRPAAECDRLFTAVPTRRDFTSYSVMANPANEVDRREGPSLGTSLNLLAQFLLVFLRMLFTYVTAAYRVIFPAEEKSVSGEIVLITGTGHGIGKELAKLYGELGATVVCVDLNEETNSKTVAELTKAGISAHAFTCDVSDRDNVLQLQQQVAKKVGDVTILINNAGIMPCRPLDQQPPALIKKQFDINVFAHFWTLEAFLPSMTKNNKGHIVALSSIAGLSGQANLVPYCATKFAVRGMMESLYDENRRKGTDLKFTTIYPFITDTGLCKKPRVRFPELFKMLSPQETASAIVSAQRRELRETTVPPFLLHLNNTIRSMPLAAGDTFVKFIDSGLEPDD